MSLPTPEQILRKIQDIINQEPRPVSISMPIQQPTTVPMPQSIPIKNPVMQQQNNTTITTVNIRELLNTLAFLKNSETYSVLASIIVPAGSTTNITRHVPKNKVIILTEYRILVSEDNNLELFTYTDNILTHADTAGIVSSLYQIPVNIIDIGQLIPAFNVLKAVLINNDTSNAITIWYWNTFIQISVEYYNKYLLPHFTTVLTE